jgi:hypothetical protein
MKRWRKTPPVTCQWSCLTVLSFRTRKTVRLQELGITWNDIVVLWTCPRTDWIDTFRIMCWSLLNGPKNLCDPSGTRKSENFQTTNLLGWKKTSKMVPSPLVSPDIALTKTSRCRETCQGGQSQKHQFSKTSFVYVLVTSDGQITARKTFGHVTSWNTSRVVSRFNRIYSFH